MEKLFSKNDIVNLILDFYIEPECFFVEEVDNNEIYSLFIQNGWGEANLETGKVELSEKGEEQLHYYIKEISMDLINYIRKNNLECFKEERVDWFEKNYNLEDTELSEELFDYICKNLHNYGYEWSSICHSKEGKKYRFEKI